MEIKSYNRPVFSHGTASKKAIPASIFPILESIGRFGQKIRKKLSLSVMLHLRTALISSF
jgi:hypothetical protein